MVFSYLHCSDFQSEASRIISFLLLLGISNLDHFLALALLVWRCFFFCACRNPFYMYFGAYRAEKRIPLGLFSVVPFFYKTVLHKVLPQKSSFKPFPFSFTSAWKTPLKMQKCAKQMKASLTFYG